MRTYAWIAAAGATLLTLQTPKTVDAVGGRYEDPNGSVEVAGVCSITSETVDCWNASGAHDAALTELIKAYYLINEQTIPMRLGMKNRYLVTKSTTKDPSRGSFNANWSASTNGYLNQCGSIYRQNSPAYTWFHVATEAAASKVDLFAQTSSPIEGVKDIEMKEGATSKVGEGELKIVTFGDYKLPAGVGGGFGGQIVPKWHIEISRKGVVNDATFYFSALDSKGQPITAVDSKGNPIPGGQPNYTFRPRNGAKAVPSGDRFYPGLGVMPKGTDAIDVTSNINPAKIGALRVNASTSLKITFRDIPLDPKP